MVAAAEWHRSSTEIDFKLYLFMYVYSAFFSFCYIRTVSYLISLLFNNLAL
jgi:hypothetical protein